MNIYNHIKNKILPNSSKRYLTAQDFQKSVQVTILGAHTPLGRFTSFLLKQNPIVSFLRLQGDREVKNLAVDLTYIDTKCKVQAFEGAGNISKSIRSSDIILLLGVGKFKEGASIGDRILKEGKRICDIAKECIHYAPRSIIIVAVPPVSVSTLLVEEVFKKSHWYHPGRIVGSAALAQVKANSLMGRYHDLDPQMCNVPLLGGPDIDLAVPLYSKARPVELPDSSAKKLALKFRGVKEHDFPKVMGDPNFIENCPTSEAFALWQMISNVGFGLCGEKQAFCNAYVRTNLVNTCKHLVTTLQFSRGGFVHNCGIPWLTKLELEMFERATLHIKEREQMAKEFLEHLECSKGDAPPFKQRELEEKRILQRTVLG